MKPRIVRLYPRKGQAKDDGNIEIEFSQPGKVLTELKARAYVSSRAHS